MDSPTRVKLSRLLVSSYDDIVKRLTSRLGSSELAREAVQDTFLKLERPAEIGPVQNPAAYLYRMAMNAAADRRTADRRGATREIEAGAEVSDDAPSPERAAMARSEIDAVKAALAALPERRRAIALAVWGEEVSHQELATRYGVSVRTIQIEIKAAMEHCARHLNHDPKKKFFGAGRAKQSD